MSWLARVRRLTRNWIAHGFGPGGGGPAPIVQPRLPCVEIGEPVALLAATIGAPVPLLASEPGVPVPLLAITIGAPEAC